MISYASLVGDISRNVANPAMHAVVLCGCALAPFTQEHFNILGTSSPLTQGASGEGLFASTQEQLVTEFRLTPFAAKKVDLSLDRSSVRSLDRSHARSLSRAIARSLDCSIARSIPRSNARSLHRSLARSRDCLVCSGKILQPPTW